MSHIDEGALHAYLDGALDSYPAAEAAGIREHLDSCAECARRLEEERRIREEAESILATSAPVVQMPPLEDLRALAERRSGATRARGLSRVNRWGWAASVVLALGTGWMLRGAIPGMISQPPLQEPAARPSVSTPAADEAVGAVILAEEDRRQDEGGPGDADPASAPGSQEEGSGGLVPAAPDAEVTGAFADVDAAEELETQVGGRDAPARAQEAVEEAVAPPPPTITQDRMEQAPAEVAPAALERVVVDSLARLREAGQPTSASRAEEPAAARRDAPSAAAEAFRNRAVEDRSRAGYVGLDVTAAAKAILGDEVLGPLVVPDLVVVDISGVEGVEVDGIVSVQQIMENGDTLEIVHLPAGSDPSALPPMPEDGRRELVAPNGDGWIILRADTSGEELETYLRRLLGG